MYGGVGQEAQKAEPPAEVRPSGLGGLIRRTAAAEVGRVEKSSGA
jgi:hypothetical protein